MAGVAVDRVDGIADHRERAVAQQIDLDQPGILGAVLLELNDRHRKIRDSESSVLAARLHRHVIGERCRRDHHATGVHRQMTGNPDQAFGVPGELLPVGGQMEPAKVGMGGDQIGQPLAGLIEEGNAPGDLPDLTGRPAVHLGHLTQRAARLKGVVIGHHGGVQPGIPAKDVGQDLVALVPGKVEIDVRRIAPLQIEKALEDELGADADPRG